jgi:CRP-like cAMP-binding protein
MALVSQDAFRQRLEQVPVVSYQPGETVIAEGSATGRLLVLRSGSVEVVKEGVPIARVSSPGAVLGEIAVLLDQAHSADVRTLEPSEFHVADARTMLASDPAVALHVAAILARRLDAANRALVEIKRQLLAGEPRRAIGRMVEQVQEMLHHTDASLAYAGYPFDPFAPERAGRP